MEQEQFSCEIKIDGKVYTSEQVCYAFRFRHSEFMFRTACAIMAGKGAEIE